MSIFKNMGRLEIKLLKASVMLGHAIIHLVKQHQEFYSECRVMTPQDDIYYGPALDDVVVVLRDKMLAVEAERGEAAKARRRRRRRETVTSPR